MDLNKLQRPIESQLSMLGFELVLLEFAQSGQEEALRIYVEHADHARPVTLEDCAAVNDGLLAWMDVEFPSFRESHAIEISSPGVERPLATPQHFQRFIGRLCRAHTRLPMDGQKRFKGWISAVSDSSVTLEEDGNLKQIPFDLIQKAKLVPFDEEKAPKHKHAAMVADESGQAQRKASPRRHIWPS